MKYWIGCSGWQYVEWSGNFYPKNLPKSQWFKYYTQYFNTVEINSTFYHFPKATTVAKWKEMAPDGFCYSLKVNRLITHYKKFHETEKIIYDFYELADLLEDKLGCLLFQLPQSIHYSKEFLERIINQLDISKKNVIEFRHSSWWCKEAQSKLAEKGIIFCSVSAPQLPTNLIPARKLYFRLHGEKKWYLGKYSTSQLEAYAKQINLNKICESWVYFDNTMDCSATNNALQFIKIITSN